MLHEPRHNTEEYSEYIVKYLSCNVLQKYRYRLLAVNYFCETLLDMFGRALNYTSETCTQPG